MWKAQTNGWTNKGIPMFSVHKKPSVHQTLLMILQNVWWFLQSHKTYCLVFWKTCREYSDWNVSWCFQNVWWFAQNQKTYCLVIRKTFHEHCHVPFQLCRQGTSLPYTLRNLEHNFLTKEEQRTERKRTERNKTPSHNKTPEYVNLTYQLPTVC